MITFKIDEETKDLVINTNNEIELVEGKDEENQTIRLLMSTNKGEWFLDVLHGLAYEILQTKNFDEERARIEIISTLNQEPRVQKVLEVNFDIDKANRKLTIYFKALMDSGNVTEGEVTV